MQTALVLPAETLARDLCVFLQFTASFMRRVCLPIWWLFNLYIPANLCVCVNMCTVMCAIIYIQVCLVPPHLVAVELVGPHQLPLQKVSRHYERVAIDAAGGDVGPRHTDGGSLRSPGRAGIHSACRPYRRCHRFCAAAAAACRWGLQRLGAAAACAIADFGCARAGLIGGPALRRLPSACAWRASSAVKQKWVSATAAAAFLTS